MPPIVIGVALRLFKNFIPMASSIRTILNVVAVVAIAVWSMRFTLIVGIVLTIPSSGLAQPFTALGVIDKLSYHLKQSAGPLALVGAAAYAGILQEADTPSEWGQGASA